MKMKTETNASNEAIWTTNVELPYLTHEECLPVIGSCQVSSILSNLDGPVPDKLLQNSIITQNMELIVLPNAEFKEQSQVKLNEELAQNFVLLKENKHPVEVDSNNKNKTSQNGGKKSKTNQADEDLEQTLYFVCNLCPFLCIKDTKINEHLETVHKSKTTTKLLQLKCPACPNIFHHKISLRSHLTHDHKVANSDLRKIIQAVIYFTKKISNSPERTINEGSHLVMESIAVGGGLKNEIELKYLEKLSSNIKILNDDDSLSDIHHSSSDLQSPEEISMSPAESIESQNGFKILQDDPIIQVAAINLPVVDISQDVAEKTTDTAVKRPNILSKYLDQKKVQKCAVPHCNVRLQDSNKMNYHIKSHINNNFKCLECNEVFAYWKPLTGHLWRVHKIDMELYSCDKCDYKTFSQGKLNNLHKLIHSDFKGYVCDICSKGFKNSQQLRNHKITHKKKSEKLTHVCDICAKAFADKRQLRVHMDGVHKKIKPFLCNYCGYKGSSKCALKLHIRQHTGEKPFACDVCDYSSADHNSLRRHKLRHTGQKPYKCIHCDYACIQSSTYKVHLKTKHPGLEKDLMFTCPDCPFRTVNKEMYLTHVSSVHKQQKKTMCA